MRKIGILGLVGVLALVLAGCGGDDRHHTVVIQSLSDQPVDGDIGFTAPATFTITAVPSGGTGYYDVEFFVGTNSIGDVFAPPFTSTATNLPAGTYTLTAIVTDYNYNQATNAITITVRSAPSIVLNTPRIAGNQFLFDVAGLTVGQTNVVQYRTNLSTGTWTSTATNVATSSSRTVTNALGGGLRFYRVFQSP